MLHDLKVNQHFVQDVNQEKPPHPITRNFINDFFLFGTLNSYKYEKKRHENIWSFGSNDFRITCQINL